ncbi:hypothetical protein DICPUDRAFT_84395 [Dictyostelium purpureum]|uniref:Uncharacterized protein n=1 Tax=Dictyostelium purpureum TaxID=5786 RepID=F1A2I5_DICPU|nr:uncharacterized protein DICPUDRAFT_84395 [Dictyostelium purpureum]EGC29596.1 hypothetical protein DICPUDRAFT_84395 [Dictyostelium purpureum]|eukprot:XP_003293880.1 hypothetical protein DICPUDRAFT_84395 [Dictyostelium purpureum]
MFKYFLIIIIIIYLNIIYGFENYDNKKLLFTDREQGYVYNLRPLSNKPTQVMFSYPGSINRKNVNISLSWSIGEEGNSYCRDKMFNETIASISNPAICLINNKVGMLEYVHMLIAKPNDLILEHKRYGIGVVSRYINNKMMYGCKTFENQDFLFEFECSNTKDEDIEFKACKFLNSNITCPSLICKYNSKFACPRIIYQQIESNSYYEDGILYTDKSYKLINYEFEYQQFNVTTDFNLKESSKGINGFNTIAPGLYSFEFNNVMTFNFTMVGDSKPSFNFQY